MVETAPKGRRRRPGSAIPGILAHSLSVLLFLGLLATVVGYLAVHTPDTFRPKFGERGLVTNEIAYHSPKLGKAHRSRDWDVTSGSLFAKDGMGWSGAPDGVVPDVDSGNGTGSAVFRMVSRRTDFGSFRMTFDIRLQSMVQTARTPAEDLDGLHLMVRYRSAQELYVISLLRRDDTVAIKRKTPGGPSNGGTYVALAGAKRQHHSMWTSVSVIVRDRGDGSVELSLALDGVRVLQAVDSGPDALRGKGAVGLRADNAEFYFRNVVVEPI